LEAPIFSPASNVFRDPKVTRAAFGVLSQTD
jgi:hypothetical protein